MNPSENWNQISRRAIWLLEHPDKIVERDSLEGMAPHLRVWHYRHEATFCSWTLFQENSFRRTDDRPLVREVCWDRPLDHARFGNPTTMLRHRIRLEPSCRVRDALVPMPDIGAVLDQIPEFMDPALPSPDAAIPETGDVFGVEGYGALACLRYEWTKGGKEVPDEMVLWAEHLRDLLIRCLEDRLAGL